MGVGSPGEAAAWPRTSVTRDPGVLMPRSVGVLSVKPAMTVPAPRGVVRLGDSICKGVGASTEDGSIKR